MTAILSGDKENVYIGSKHKHYAGKPNVMLSPKRRKTSFFFGDEGQLFLNEGKQSGKLKL